MNGITRVFISVLLLGACAIAMRYTMQSLDSGESKRQLVTARLDTKKAKKIELRIAASGVERLHIKPSQAGRIAGTYDFRTDSLIESSLRINDSTLDIPPVKKGVLQASYNAYSYSNKSFFFGRPLAYGVAELRLPKEVPLSLNIFAQNFPKPPRAFIDLRGLEIEKADVGLGVSNFEELSLSVAQGKPNSVYFVRNDYGKTKIWFYQQSLGAMNLHSEKGQIQVNHMGVHTNIRMAVIGIASSATDFRKRLNLSNSSLVWQEPKLVDRASNQWGVVGQSKNATSDLFYLQVYIHKQARLEVWN